MVNPVPGYRITTPYRKRGNLWRACGWHTGADWKAPNGTPVVAAVPGDVRLRDYGTAFGIQVAISGDPGDPFGEGEVFYAHLSSIKPGVLNTRVAAGDVIGYVGSTGNSTGPHLHLELHSVKNQWGCGVMRDPQPVVDWQPRWVFPSGHKVYQRFLKWEGHKQNSDGVSDSVKAWQEMMNRALKDGDPLPLTGKWSTLTAGKTQTHQRLHVPPPDEPLQAVFVGPKQFAKAKDQTGAPYVWVPDTVDPKMPWLCAAGAALRTQVTGMYPGRDTRTDGWVGDDAHCGPGKPPSEHCPDPGSDPPDVVRAIDIDADLIPGESRGESQRLADLIVAAGRAGDRRLWYVIHNGVIRSQTHGWVDREYTGSDPHESHIHVSFKPEGDGDGDPFDLAPHVGVGRDEFDALRRDVAALADRFVRHTHKTGRPE